MQTPTVQKEIWERTLHVAFPKKINKSEIEKVLLHAPNKSEQAAIGNFFHTLDDTIALHQEKLEALKRMKTAYLDKIFSQEIRFSGFGETWEQRKLGEVVQGYNKIVKGNEYPIASSSRKGLYLQTDYFNGERSGIDESLDFHLVPQGYVTYRHMSDDSTFHFNRNSMNTPVLVSKEYPVFTNKDDNNLDFILYHLNSTARFASFSHMQKKGGTRVRLYFKMLETYKLYMPASAEQKKVGAILKQWENTIALHHQKIDSLHKLKCAYLQQMFL